VAEQSHRDEMNAAIRAQRERQAVPRSMVSTEDVRPPEAAQAAPAPERAPAEPKRGFLSRLRGR
jgi:hypothetical protein